VVERDTGADTALTDRGPAVDMFHLD